MSRRASEKQIISLGLVLTACFASLSAQHETKIIETVDVQGNRRLSDEEILRSVETRPGQPLKAARLRTDLQRLLALGQFDAGSTRTAVLHGREGGVHVVFEVRELQLIGTFDLDGLKYVTADQIRLHLKSRDLEVLPNTPYDPSRMRKVIKCISELLFSRGYKEAKISVWEEEKSWAEIAIKIVIDEMPGDEDHKDGESKHR